MAWDKFGIGRLISLRSVRCLCEMEWNGVGCVGWNFFLGCLMRGEYVESGVSLLIMTFDFLLCVAIYLSCLATSPPSVLACSLTLRPVFSGALPPVALLLLSCWVCLVVLAFFVAHPRFSTQSAVFQLGTWWRLYILRAAREGV